MFIYRAIGGKSIGIEAIALGIDFFVLMSLGNLILNIPARRNTITAKDRIPPGGSGKEFNLVSLTVIKIYLLACLYHIFPLKIIFTPVLGARVTPRLAGDSERLPTNSRS